VLGGYSFSRRDWDACHAVRRSWRCETPPGCATVAAKLGFVPAWMQNAAAERAVLSVLLVPELAAEADHLDPYGALIDEFDFDGQLRGRHPVVQSLFLWSRSVLPGYILFSDRMEMAHGLEARLPFLDHVLFDCTRHIPVPLLVSGPCTKRLLRDIAHDIVTPEVAHRPKQPFAAPALATGESDHKHEIRSRIRAGLSDQGFFEPAAVRAFLDRLDRMSSASDTRFEPALMLIASTLAMQRRYRLTSWRA
jgi:asparagine synthase (glutamine-hydrolysing)